MAKNYKDPDSTIPEPEAPKTFTSLKGVTIRLKPVSQFKISELNASREEIPVPTYEVEIVGGDKQEFALDEKVAESKGRMDEWRAYLAKNQKENKEFSDRFTDLLIWDGVDVDVPGTDSEWQAACDSLGIKLPDDPVRRKSIYVRDELLCAAEDLGELTACILDVSHASRERVRKMRESFRAGIQREANKELPAESEPVENA